MQRYNLNLKGGTYQESDTYDLIPIYRQQVVPGQTVSLDAQVNMKSTALTKLITTPTLCSVWFFYVPHRLVWDDWTNFISKEEGYSFDIATTFKAPFFFDNYESASSPLMSPLYRRAYKLVCNEYFSSKPYRDVTADSANNPSRAKNPEQFVSHLVDNDQVEDPEFPVVASSIPLNEFYRAQMNARSKQRSQMTGDKYVDTLARMGVDASWMIAERPEFLGTKSKLVNPVLHSSTESATLGQEVSRFNCSTSVQIANKHFAEHGYIVGIACMRPLVFFPDRAAPDAEFVNQAGSANEWIENFYSADNLQTRDAVFDRVMGQNFATNTWSASRFAYLKRGTWLYGQGTSWVPEVTPTDWDDFVYPNGQLFDFFSETELGGNQVAVTTAVNLKGKTPVPNHVA
ncbi:TPA_asm: major capsid protein [Microviridae sp.]|nr:TPA_asm: major capsid protein [Microviridae sp.]